MIKLDFQHFKVYSSVSHKASQTVDVRETFADMIYNNVNGIRAHALAMKIYESNGEREYDENEVKLIQAIADKMCVPGFIDGLKEQIDNTQTE